MSAGLWHLQQKKERLKREVSSNLDFVIGSITSQGPSGGFILTQKEGGKTKSKYIRAGMLNDVRAMTRRHKKIKELLKELAEVNWEIVKLNSES
jgi:hypothetical protein